MQCCKCVKKWSCHHFIEKMDTAAVDIFHPQFRASVKKANKQLSLAFLYQCPNQLSVIDAEHSFCIKPTIVHALVMLVIRRYCPGT